MNLATHYDPLVERLQMRDQQAFNELLDKYGARMYGTARRFASSEGGAEEVVQDTLINVWNNIDKFHGRARLSTWLYRITVNAGLMRLRKDKQGRRFESIDARQRIRSPRRDNGEQLPTRYRRSPQGTR